MKPKTLFLLFSLITLSASCSGKSLEPTRSPAVAAAFYPADKIKLSALIDHYLSQAPEQKVSPEILALIVPHAGYIYSGQVAAYGYKLIQHQSFDTVILIGPSHHQYLNVASIYTTGSWETPLGKVPVDSAMAKALANENILFTCSDQAHAKEHSLEVQLPFLQKVLKNFKIIPILVSNPTVSNCALLAQAILKHCDRNKKYLFIISTDMSHYYNDEQAKVMDRGALDLLERQDITKLSSALDTGAGELCGRGAVLTALEIARLKGPAKIKILKYATSGDVTGDRARVVGYTSAVIYLEPVSVEKEKKMLTQAQQQELLKIARKTIETYITSGNVPDFKVTDLSLIEKRGVFVT
ncbi:MAG: AmmeMemoRadiSam system protein B, partial [Elusimicrobia bacterium]|nr:AmmeMemoRadiSam system protein B [Elusimicrobiota bacterium]